MAQFQFKDPLAEHGMWLAYAEDTCDPDKQEMASLAADVLEQIIEEQERQMTAGVKVVVTKGSAS